MHVPIPADLPVANTHEHFDPNAGSRLERLVFNNRRLVIIACALLTVLLGAVAVIKLSLGASFEKMIPQSHPYIQNYLEHRNDLRALGNSLRIVVENTQGDIYDPKYLNTLKQINDELFLTPGVDRAWVKSLWAPGVRWTEVTEEGFRGGPVMPDNYDGSPKSTEQLRANIARSGLVGNLVGNNFKSTMIVVPLLDQASGERIDYRALSNNIEAIRAKYECADQAGGQPAIRIHAIGFAKLVGDLIDGLFQVALYFGVAALIARSSFLLYALPAQHRAGDRLLAGRGGMATRLVAALRFELDPYSILVPFLVFAIGVSHGAQKMNGIMQDIGRGTHELVAARLTFRRLFLAGLTALLADAVGFAVLMVIDIPVIKDLAITASIGVAVLIFTNLILLPVLLSYVGVSAARRSAACARIAMRCAAKASTNSGAGSTALSIAAGRSAHCGRAGAGADRFRGQPESEDRRSRPWCTRAACRTRATTATTPTSPSIRAVSDLFAVIVKTRKGRLPELRDAGPGRSTGLGAAAGAGRADHGVAGQRRASNHRRHLRRQPEVADDRSATRTC